MRRFQIAPRPAALLMAALFLVPHLAEAQTNIKPGFNLFKPEDDVQVGQQSAAQAEQQLPILNDASVTDYVNAIGQRLASNAGGPKFQYHFKVVNSSDINAFALPGGFVYINRGVLENSRNEGEVAGVMAHEISHVALRHGTHQASKAYLAQAGIGILGGILGGKVGQGTADIINQVGGLGMNALFLKYSRDLESQADIRGAQIMTASGYSPADMVSFFQTLEKVDPAKKTSFLSDHPAPPDRIARIQREAALLHAPATPTRNVAELQQIQGRLRGTGSAGTTQVARNATTATSGRQRTTGRGAQGAVIQVEAPSSTMRTFTSPSRVYQLSYPANWQVFAEGNTGVTFAPQGGAGNVNGQSQIVYGAIVNHYEPFNSSQHNSLRGLPSAGSSLQDATNDLVQQLVQTSPYLRLASNTEQRINVSGGNALVATLGGVDPATGLQERVTVVTRQLADQDLVYMLFITPEREASRYQPVLQTMVNSIRINDSQAH
jgi:beta-barrel assembly-enhancing protease